MKRLAWGIFALSLSALSALAAAPKPAPQPCGATAEDCQKQVDALARQNAIQAAKLNDYLISIAQLTDALESQKATAQVDAQLKAQADAKAAQPKK